MSLPKPGLSINYGQDEIRVPIGQSFISHSQGHAAQRKFCCFFFFFLPFPEQEQAMQGNEPKWIVSQAQWITKKKSTRKESAKSQRERKTTVGLSIFSSPVAFWLSWRLLIPGLVLVCSPWRQLGNQVGEGHWGRAVLFLNTQHQENSITNPRRTRV